MKSRTMFRILGMLLSIFSCTLLPPIAVGLYYGDGGSSVFFYTFVVSFCIGFTLWFFNRRVSHDLKNRDGFLIVVLFWLVLGFVGAIPFWIPDQFELSFTDAMFESFSGLTTTGASILIEINQLPQSYLYYRQQLQWLGGMGVIVLAVAVLPLLGIGGMQLYRAEQGPMKDQKMTPRIADTAKHLWYIYLGITALCAMAYWVAGMSLFDAIGHAFSTVSIGGFSTHDESFAFFDSLWINLIGVIFILIAGANFALHFGAVRGKSVRIYLADPEFRAFIWIQGVLIAICVLTLLLFQTYESIGDAISHGLFQAVSISTTTGFTVADYPAWPVFLPLLLILASFIGGSAGSTGGGLKVIRVLLLFRQGVRELNRLVHPKGVFSIKYGDRPLPERMMQAVWGFFAAYAFVFVCVMLGFIAAGMDDYLAFSAAAATLNNLGVGLGPLDETFHGLSDAAKWVAIVSMVFGRLEIFTLLVILTPSFWRDS